MNMQWSIVLYDQHTIDVELRNPITGLNVAYPDMVITRPPAITVNGTLPTWSLEWLSDVSFRLTCPEELPESGVYILPPYDAGMRTSLGGYLLPKFQDLVAVIPIDITSATRVTDHEVEVQFANVTTSINTLPIGHGWTPLGVPTTTPSGYLATDFFATGNSTAHATFVEDISTESTIVLPGGCAVDTTGRVCAGGDIPFT